MSDRRFHPQVIRAKELWREAGLDVREHSQSRFMDAAAREHFRARWRRFMDAAFEEHFQREAVDNIYWDRGGSFYTDKWDISSRDGDCHFGYGRCKSGQRWFWSIDGWVRGGAPDEPRFDEHGWADTEEQALINGTAAIKRLAAGRRVIAFHHHGWASRTLKEINAAKRVKRWTDAPVDGSDSHAVEYLHDQWGDQFRITKKTAQRIYYVKEESRFGYPPQIGFVPCHRVADDWPGPTWRELRDLQNRVGYRNAPEFFLKPRPSGFDREPPPKIDLRELKAAMAAAHPDKGGSNQAFIEARKVYVDARRAVRQGRLQAA